MEKTSKPHNVHIPIRKDWLALRDEPALEPERPIIDPHHHLWNRPESPYYPADIVEDIAGHNVVATVFSQCVTFYREGGDPLEQPLGETETVTALAEEHDAKVGGPRIAAGIVGYVDLVTAGAKAGYYIDQHIKIARGRICGFRDTSSWHADPHARASMLMPPPGMLYYSNFRDGLTELADRNLVFDAWMNHKQLGELCDLAGDMPHVSIVVCHTGGPLGIGPYEKRQKEVFADWDYFMGRLSDFPNIVVKLGGFGMFWSGFKFYEQPMPPTSDAVCEVLSPYILRCIELFGADRCMFESNFPVDKGNFSYRILWNAFKKMVASRSATEKHQLFFETANKTYSLGITC